MFVQLKHYNEINVRYLSFSVSKNINTQSQYTNKHLAKYCFQDITILSTIFIFNFYCRFQNHINTEDWENRVVPEAVKQIHFHDNKTLNNARGWSTSARRKRKLKHSRSARKSVNTSSARIKCGWLTDVVDRKWISPRRLTIPIREKEPIPSRYYFLREYFCGPQNKQQIIWTNYMHFLCLSVGFCWGCLKMICWFLRSHEHKKNMGNLPTVLKTLVRNFRERFGRFVFNKCESRWHTTNNYGELRIFPA